MTDHYPTLSSIRNCCKIFPTVEYAYTAIPTYPSGQIGFMLLSNTAGDGTCVSLSHVPFFVSPHTHAHSPLNISHDTI